MKASINFTVLVIGSLMLVNVANAEPPREQLKQMKEQMPENSSDVTQPSAKYTAPVKQIEAEIEMAIVYVSELAHCVNKLDKEPAKREELAKQMQEYRKTASDIRAKEVAQSGGNPLPALEEQRDILLYFINNATYAAKFHLGEQEAVTVGSLRAAIKDEKNRAVPICSGRPSFRGTVQGDEYTSPNRMFSVRIPKPSNWARLQYTIKDLDTNGDSQYDKVMFHVRDFGAYLVAGTRLLPANAVSLMDKDDHRTVLRNVSQASLVAWRTDLRELPKIAQESFIDSQYGEAIVRVYRAKNGSLLVKAEGRRPIRGDTFDTNIISIVARQGALVVYVLAQNDDSPDDSNVAVRMATELFQDIRVSTGR